MVREEPRRLRGVDASDPPVGEMSRDLIERPRRAAEALAGPPLDRVDVGVERPESGAARHGRARPEGRQDAVPGAGQRVRHRGGDAVPGRHERRAEARRHERRSSRAHPSASSARAAATRARRAELGRLTARAVGRRGLVVLGARSRAGARGRRPAPRGSGRGDRCLEPRRHHGERERAPHGPRPDRAAGRRRRWRPPRRRPATRGRGPGRPAVELAAEGAPRRARPRRPSGPRRRPSDRGRRVAGTAPGRQVSSEGSRHEPARLPHRAEDRPARQHRSRRAALAGRPGWVVEFGLGRGRSYSHLAERFPDREIYCFDREHATNPGWGPPRRARRRGRPRDGAGRSGRRRRASAGA